jgi:co-chaperonin GroES (HSP10)
MRRLKRMIKTPLHRVTVIPFDVDEWDETRKKAKSLGFALPDADMGGVRAKASVDMGSVFQIGRTAFKDFGDTPIKVGDTVAYVKNSGKFVKDPFDQKEYLVLNDEDIVAIFEKE